MCDAACVCSPRHEMNTEDEMMVDHQCTLHTVCVMHVFKVVVFTRLYAFVCVCMHVYVCEYVTYMQGFDEFMNLVLDEGEEVSVKRAARKPLGRLMLKGDAITLIQEVGG